MSDPLCRLQGCKWGEPGPLAGRIWGVLWPLTKKKKPRKRGAWSFDNGSHNPFKARYMTGAPDLHWTVRDIHP